MKKGLLLSILSIIILPLCVNALYAQELVTQTSNQTICIEGPSTVNLALLEE
jgi:hypothetical protein